MSRIRQNRFSDPTGERPRLVLFYHRDTRNKFHGEAVYVRQFIVSLKTPFDLVTVAPGGGELDPPRFSGLLPDSVETLGLQARVLLGMKGILPSEQRSVIVVADVYLYLVPMLIARIRQVPLVFLCSDLPGRYAASWAGSQKGRGSLMRILRSVLDGLSFATCDAVVVRTDAMRAALASNPRWKHLTTWIAPHRPVQSFPDRERIRSFQRERALPPGPLLVFAGDCHYPPNAEAVRYILRDLAPALATSSPTACIVIVGPGSESWTKEAGPNVRLLGPVDDISSLFYGAHVGLAPIRVEGGVSSKVIDYLAHGLTVVATPEAAVGQPDQARLVVLPFPRFREGVEELLRSGKVFPALDTYLAERGMERDRGDEEHWTRFIGELFQIANDPGGFKRSGPPSSGRTRARPPG